MHAHSKQTESDDVSFYS
jgi:hypothetical protein